MLVNKIVEQFEQSIAQMEWRKEEASKYGKTILTMLEPHLITYLIGYPKIGKAYVMKIEGHPLVKYIDFLEPSDIFLFVGDENHHESVHPDELIAYECNRRGLSCKLLINNDNGFSVLDFNGIKIFGRDRTSFKKMFIKDD